MRWWNTSTVYKRLLRLNLSIEFSQYVQFPILHGESESTTFASNSNCKSRHTYELATAPDVSQHSIPCWPCTSGDGCGSTVSRATSAGTEFRPKSQPSQPSQSTQRGVPPDGASTQEPLYTWIVWNSLLWQFNWCRCGPCRNRHQQQSRNGKGMENPVKETIDGWLQHTLAEKILEGSWLRG